jgi:hypothetical protein
MGSAVTGIAVIDGFISIIAENFVATLLQVGFGALIGVAVLKVKRMIDRRPVYRTWRRICENQTEVPIVISSIVFKEFEIAITRGSAVLPPNITLVGLYDGLAVAELRSALSEAFPKCRFPICTDKNFNDISRPFITIGGGSVNAVSRRVIASLKPAMKLDIVYPDHYFVDEGRGGRPVEIRSVVDHATQEITEDFGAAVMAKNPFSQNESIVLLFGIWPFGTYSAAKALAKPKQSNVFSEIQLFLRKRDDWLVVVKAPVHGLVSGTPQFMYGRALPSRAEAVSSLR